MYEPLEPMRLDFSSCVLPSTEGSSSRARRSTRDRPIGLELYRMVGILIAFQINVDSEKPQVPVPRIQSRNTGNAGKSSLPSLPKRSGYESQTQYLVDTVFSGAMLHNS